MFGRSKKNTADDSALGDATVQNDTNGVSATSVPSVSPLLDISPPPIATPPVPPAPVGADSDNTANPSDLSDGTAAATDTQVEPQLEYKKGPFDTKPEENAPAPPINTTPSTPPAISDTSDSETANTIPTLSASLNLSDEKEKDANPFQPATDTTFPAVQLDEKEEPEADDHSKDDFGKNIISSIEPAGNVAVKGSSDDLDKLMDEIIWDLAGVQAKIRQLKGMVGDNQKNKSLNDTLNFKDASDSIALEVGVTEKKDDIGEHGVTLAKDSSEDPLSGYNIS